MSKQKIYPGISSGAVKFIPETWSAEWFRHFITGWLQNSDTRNAISGAGISITGGVNTPATISASLLVGPAFSIVGNPTNETGGDTNIAATARGQVLTYNGGAILFSTLELADNSGLGPSFSVGPGVTSGQVLQVGSDTADAAFSQIVFPTAVAPGDLIIGTAVTNVIGGLSIGTSAQVLLVDTGLPVWHNQADLFAAAPAAISQGGTNATTAPAALNNLLPVQVAGEWLTTDGTTPSWASLPAPPVESIGWGTPVNAAVQNNFDGAAATLAQTSAALAELITNLIAAGYIGA